MKNLLKKYQLPASGWEYWYVGLERYDTFDEYADAPNGYIDNPIHLLPQQQSMNFDEWNSKCRKYDRNWDEHLKRAENIIYGSTGKDISVVHSKVKAVMKWTRGHRGTIDSFMKRSIDTYEMKDGEMYFRNTKGGYINRHAYYRRMTILYIDKNNTVQQHIIDKPKKYSVDSRRRYQMLTWKRRLYKERRRDVQRISSLYLQIINKPELMHFYTKATNEYKWLNSVEDDGHADRPEMFRKETKEQFWWRTLKWSMAKKAFTLEKRRRRDKIRQDLDNMMTGDFSSYYNSKEYIYSLQRECHHFDNINH